MFSEEVMSNTMDCWDENVLIALCNVKEYERAKQRGVDIYGEMLGYGMSGKI